MIHSLAAWPIKPHITGINVARADLGGENLLCKFVGLKAMRALRSLKL